MQEARVVGKSALESSYAVVVRIPSWRDSNSIRVKNREKEDLERLGRLWANSWGLKGKLGLAKLEKDRVLLEFKELKEARRVVPSGSRELGGGVVISRAEQPVEKELVSARLETLNLPDDVRGAQENGSDRESGNQVQGLVIREWVTTDGLAWVVLIRPNRGP
ncbi:hypothetical protein CK203_089195 [Vitis vinifera]|uniref:DUF4283 domain-containing protein n=1 Tax=Vitis vinifera TaxID=29760 RepID=A0A438EJW3_VITVI|nr:hypothetical protein CK203_089195 [Vitis vinifera]